MEYITILTWLSALGIPSFIFWIFKEFYKKKYLEVLQFDKLTLRKEDNFLILDIILRNPTALITTISSFKFSSYDIQTRGSLMRKSVTQISATYKVIYDDVNSELIVTDNNNDISISQGYNTGSTNFFIGNLDQEIDPNKTDRFKILIDQSFVGENHNEIGLEFFYNINKNKKSVVKYSKL